MLRGLEERHWGVEGTVLWSATQGFKAMDSLGAYIENGLKQDMDLFLNDDLIQCIAQIDCRHV